MHAGAQFELSESDSLDITDTQSYSFYRILPALDLNADDPNDHNNPYNLGNPNTIRLRCEFDIKNQRVNKRQWALGSQ